MGSRERRSFAAQDVLVPWHLGDQHNHQKKSDFPRNGASTNNVSSNQQTCQTDQTATAAPPSPAATRGGAVLDHPLPTLPPARSTDSTDSVEVPNDPQLAPITCKHIDSIVGNGVGAEGDTGASNQGTGGQGSTNTLGSVGSVSAPTPYAPRHGVRIHAGAGPGGSVVYQRYCHMYAEGELEGLVESVDGLRVVKSYYDRSNWCVVAERKV